MLFQAPFAQLNPFYHPLYLDIMHLRLCARLSPLFCTINNGKFYSDLGTRLGVALVTLFMTLLWYDVANKMLTFLLWCNLWRVWISLVTASFQFTIDLEIFVLQNFCFHFSCINVFVVKDTNKNSFDGIKLILCSQVWWSGMRLCTPRNCGTYEPFAVFVATICSCWWTAHVRKRTEEHCRHVLWQWRQTVYRTLSGKLSGVFVMHVSAAGIDKVAVSGETTS